MSLRDEMVRFIAPLKRQLSTVVGRAILRALDDTTALQLVRISTGPGEYLDKVERVQNYGFTSVPEAPSEAIVICPGGNRSQAIAIAIDSSANRKKGLAPGDTCVYNGKTGDYILLNADGVKIHSSGKVVVDAGTIELSNASALDLKALMTEDLITLFNGHTHVCAAPGVVASTPVDVFSVPIVLTTANATTKTKAG